MSQPAPLTRASLRRIRARDLVVHHTALATGSMVVPIVGLDVAVQLAVQVRMARELCKLYQAPFDATGVREVVIGLVGGRSAEAVRVTALRYLSFASYFVGRLPSAGMTAGYTWMLGGLLIDRLETTGRIDVPDGTAADAPAILPAP
jgi:uncharacterized protein (DUF697 family)